MRLTTILIPVLLLAGSSSNAAEPTPAASPDTNAAFTRLKTLAGEWQADTPMGKSHVRYELMANGTALVEHETFEGMPEHSMMTVYYLDGNRLLLTHYCAAGNQPRMQASTYNPDRGEIAFRFLDATNLPNPGAGHMHNATLRLVDANHLESDWEFYEGGHSKGSHPFRYTRVR